MMLLELGSKEEFEFRIAAFDPPPAENMCESFGADNLLTPEVFRVVAVDAALEQNFQQ